MDLTLGLSQCDFLEQAKKLKDCQQLYIKLQEDTAKPIVWIQYQRFIRRNGDVCGKKGLNHDEKSKIDCARKIFTKARKSKEQLYMACIRFRGKYGIVLQQASKNCSEHF